MQKFTGGYKFKDPEILQNALVHPSTGKDGGEFQRLEFLGDRVLGLVIAEKLLELFPKDDEGMLSKKLSLVVSQTISTLVAKDVGFHELVAKNNSQDSKVLCDCIEAFIGALYLDSNSLDLPRKFILRHWMPYLLRCEDQVTHENPKGRLQEYSEKFLKAKPVYSECAKRGTSHEPVIVVKVQVPVLNEFGVGTGKSKRAAEAEAARKMLAALNIK